MNKAFNLDEALVGHFVKIKGTNDPKRIVGQSVFRSDEYIIEDKYGVYRLSLDRLQNGFYMYGERESENEKKQESELTCQDLIVGHVYEAKKKQITFVREINDRQILWIGEAFYKGEYQEVVQYDSPTVKNGKHYTKVSVEQFLKWAKADVTAKMPKGEWRTE